MGGFIASLAHVVHIKSVSCVMQSVCTADMLHTVRMCLCCSGWGYGMCIFDISVLRCDRHLELLVWVVRFVVCPKCVT